MCARYEGRVLALTLYAGDGGDLVTPTHAATRSGPQRRARGPRVARLLALALLCTLAAALVVGPSAARAATYNTWTRQTSGTTTTLYGVSFTDASNGWIVRQRRPHPPHHERRHDLELPDLDHDTQTLRGVFFVDRAGTAGRSAAAARRRTPRTAARPGRRRPRAPPRPCAASTSATPTPAGWWATAARSAAPSTARHRRHDLGDPDLGHDLDALRRALQRRQQRLGGAAAAAWSAAPRTAATPAARPGQRRPRARPRPSTASPSPTRATAGSSATAAPSTTPRTAAPPGRRRPRAYR